MRNKPSYLIIGFEIYPYYYPDCFIKLSRNKIMNLYLLINIYYYTSTSSRKMKSIVFHYKTRLKLREIETKLLTKEMKYYLSNYDSKFL